MVWNFLFPAIFFLFFLFFYSGPQKLLVEILFFFFLEGNKARTEWEFQPLRVVSSCLNLDVMNHFFSMIIIYFNLRIWLSILSCNKDDLTSKSSNPHVQVRGALETLVSALTPLDNVKGPKNEVQPALMNTDLLSREAESISLLLSLLVSSIYVDFNSYSMLLIVHFCSVAGGLIYFLYLFFCFCSQRRIST